MASCCQGFNDEKSIMQVNELTKIRDSISKASLSVITRPSCCFFIAAILQTSAHNDSGVGCRTVRVRPGFSSGGSLAFRGR